MVMIMLLAFPIVSAINLGIQKVSSNEALIADLNQPSPIDLKVTNNGNADTFLFYSFFAGGITPKSTILINGYETKNIQIGILPRDDLKTRGFVSFDYFIDSQTGEQKENMIIKVIELKDSFEIEAGNINYDKGTIEVYVKNLYNYNFDKVNARFSSPFFDGTTEFSLAPKEKKVFNININKDEYRKLIAGYYTIKADLTIGGKTANVEGQIKFDERNMVVSSEKKTGFIITTWAIQKENEGNVVSGAETTIKKNIISRLFTTFNNQPDTVERKGLGIYYTWAEELTPGEKFSLTVRTNWLFPLLIVVFIVAIIALARLYSLQSLVLRKRVNFVRAKGGEFALKVSVHVQARKFVEKVSITDRLPPLVKLHENFNTGTELPKRVDLRNRKIEWHFPKMQAGESKVLSYVIYSKVGVVGRFALPKAVAVYDREGTIHEGESNQAFFVAEQKAPRDE